ncbi:DUF29 family protein [Rippkaea orientalis]|uniref:DUF29 family protein n=1 Tax=Rippkaea orientalis TaxID=2546366 RepID=UPI0001723CA9|nr:DUF29 family protein [Rippkaea orientalis]
MTITQYLTDIFNESYQDAQDLAATETGLSLDNFPLDCPFTPEETLDSNYLPE